MSDSRCFDLATLEKIGASLSWRALWLQSLEVFRSCAGVDTVSLDVRKGSPDGTAILTKPASRPAHAMAHGREATGS